MDKLMKQSLEQNKIIRYIPTFIKVMETYKKLLENHNEAFRQCNVSGRSELLLAFVEHIKKDNELTETVNANDVDAFLKSQQ